MNNDPTNQMPNSPDEASALRLKANFNARSKGVHEVEIKRLVKDNDRSVFEKIERFFVSEDWIRLMAKNKPLQTRQLDTINLDLLAKGKTLRIRGEARNGNLHDIDGADICLKEEKTMTASGAVKRNEFEAPIRSFETATLRPLLQKYPKADFPDLHETLHNIRVRDLREHFRIDCLRNRYVIELPEEVTGFKGKRFCAELIMDDVAFVMDLPGRDDPLVFHHDLEVECEVLFKPCSYDADPARARKYTSSPDLTQEEIDHGMMLIGLLLDKASGNTLAHNEDSKAERGFDNLKRTLACLSNYLSPNTTHNPADDNRLTSAFTLNRKPRAQNDNHAPDDVAAEKKAVNEDLAPATTDDDNGDRLHKHLDRSMAHVVRDRPIARRPRPF